MPSYQVLRTCFHQGMLYDPDGKRPVLHRDEPFETVDKKEQVPSALKRLKDETPSQKKARLAKAAKADKAAATKKTEDKVEMDAVTFLDDKKSTVETL